MNLTVLLILSGFFVNCGTDSTKKGLTGDWRLTEMEFAIDGAELIAFSVETDKITFDKEAYAYSDNGLKKGTWMVSDDGSELSVSYGLESIVSFPIISQTNAELTYQAAIIDLNASVSDTERGLMVLASQAMNQAGRNFNTETVSGSEIKVNFTLTRE